MRAKIVDIGEMDAFYYDKERFIGCTGDFKPFMDEGEGGDFTFDNKEISPYRLSFIDIKVEPLIDNIESTPTYPILDLGFTFGEQPKPAIEGGTKHDNGKLRLDLIPPEVEMALGEVLTYGATKYDDRNWEKGIKYGRVYGALRRHLLSWLEGERLDQESEMPHLWHALCCLSFLVAYEERGMKGFDDLHIMGKTLDKCC